MKKNKFNILLLTFLMAGFTFTSCENEDDATGDSVAIVNDGVAAVEAVTPGLSFSAPNNVNEGGSQRIIQYAITLQEVQPVDVYVTVSLVSGDAIEGEDFDFDHSVIVPAFTKKGVGTVTILKDDIEESTETFTLKIGDVFDANVSFAGANLVFNITDFGALNLILDWNTTFQFSGLDLTLCDIGYDVDYYLVDMNGEAVEMAATADCPETMVLDLAANADLVDGTYEIMMNIWDDAGLSTVGIDPAFEIVTNVTYSRDNSTFAGAFAQDSADGIDSNYGSDPSNLDPKYVATLKIENGMFTLSKNGSAIGTGKLANLKNKLAAKNANRVKKPSYFN
ncbi:hypothetical protein [Flavobacterium sp.]|uniref:hypothetical protein n=1 Tax=Flavobacterium sp. TaxID=239 RepID=UPI00262CBC3A|nr:hypothetical protein [Flavobacterium sp.]MDD2987265.1 hypothetical protein [Flavobacterium sp.]